MALPGGTLRRGKSRHVVRRSLVRCSRVMCRLLRGRPCGLPCQHCSLLPGHVFVARFFAE
eukprot:11552029-Prorocentrum_lima.AAC.1